MKSIYCSKFWIGFLFFIMMFHLFLTIISISVLVDNIASGGHNLFVLITIVVILQLMIIAGLIGSNRLASIITYDEERKVLIRKGFFGGYHYTLNVCDIVEVVTASFPRSDKYFILIDKYKTKMEPGSKSSYLSITYSEHAKKFISQFYDVSDVK